ncbi:PH domain-containing protein, partial [Streptomyces sp. NPDC006450]|uniref:PH domain-containing protein n=1 Tax=Streptomyces sp. NPDC006450 TaxID=3155458 RepID=UPI0033A2D899
MDTGTEGEAGPPEWVGLPGGLLTLRRLVLALWMSLFAVVTAVVLGMAVGPGWAAAGGFWLVVLAWGWVMLGRNWRSWRYAERADDLLISRGVMWREQTVVPYGRMQLVEVASGPLERRVRQLDGALGVASDQIALVVADVGDDRVAAGL